MSLGDHVAKITEMTVIYQKKNLHLFFVYNIFAEMFHIFDIKILGLCIYTLSKLKMLS